MRLFAGDEVAALMSQVLDSGVKSFGLEGDLNQGSSGGPADAIVFLKKLQGPSRLESIPATQPGDGPIFVLPTASRSPTSIASTAAEVPMETNVPRTHETVAEVASRISELSGLTDRQLAGCSE